MEVPVTENGAGNGKTIPIKKRKAMVASRYITKNVPKIAALAKLISSGDKSTFSEYETLVGPVQELG
jgi:hypothetical protein